MKIAYGLILGALALSAPGAQAQEMNYSKLDEASLVEQFKATVGLVRTYCMQKLPEDGRRPPSWAELQGTEEMLNTMSIGAMPLHELVFSGEFKFDQDQYTNPVSPCKSVFAQLGAILSESRRRKDSKVDVDAVRDYLLKLPAKH